jgi:hypothetical protein
VASWTASGRGTVIVAGRSTESLGLAKMLRAIALIAALAAVHVCVADETAYRLATLPSGKQIKVLGVGQMAFTEGPPGLMLKYETDIPIENVPALEREADEIWLSFRSDVERAGLRVGIVSANEKPSGFIITKNRGYNFVFERGADGRWAKSKPKSR